MDQIHTLITLMYQLIGDNRFLIDAMNSMIQRGDRLPSIELTYTAGSEYWHSTNIIIMGLSDVIDCYVHAQGFNFQPTPMINVNTDYDNYNAKFEKCKGISISMPMTESECLITGKLFSDTYFLKEKEMSIYDALTVYSLAYSLYHEIGHALHDKDIPEAEPIKREIAADAFAYEALKSMCEIEDGDVLLLGTIIGVTHVFNKLSYDQEKVDDKHPYTIERLYQLLVFWGLKDNSPIWDLIIIIIKKWCKKNILSMEWDNDNFNSNKEKFTKAYQQFRKIVNDSC